MSWISCSCSAPVVRFLTSVSISRNVESFICWGFFYDLGSGWLKMERWDLYFQFSCMNVLTLTFFYLKQATFAKFFPPLRLGTNIFWGFLASLCCHWMGILSRLWKHTNELQKFSALAIYFQRRLDTVPLTTSVCWKANYSSPHFHFHRSLPVLTSSEYPELEGTHKDQVQLLALHKSALRIPPCA